MGKRVKIGITFDEELLKRVDRLAKLSRQSRSRALEDLVADALEQNEGALKAAADPVVMGAFMRALSEPGVMRGIASAVRSDLSDDQLALFNGALERSGLLPESAQKLKRRRGGK